MKFVDGLKKMEALRLIAKPGTTSTHAISRCLVLTYPGYKGPKDYCLLENGIAPKHTAMVEIMYQAAMQFSQEEIGTFLDDVYANGTDATNILFSRDLIEKLFWMTLQEEINYPPPTFLGRKMPFQRYFEGVLAQQGQVSLQEVMIRTDSHKRLRPFPRIKGFIPSFYR